MPEPVIPCKHTRFISDTRLTVAENATVFYSEIFMGGRKYYNEENFSNTIFFQFAAWGASRRQATVQREFVIDPAMEHPRNLGVMGRFDVFANVSRHDSKEKADEIYDRTEAFLDRSNMIAQG